MADVINVVSGQKKSEVAAMLGEQYASTEWLGRCTGKSISFAMRIVSSAIQAHGKTISILGVGSELLNSQVTDGDELQNLRVAEINILYVIERMNLKGFKVTMDSRNNVLSVRCDIFQVIDG